MNLDKETTYEITVAATNNEGGIGENTTYIRATGSPFSVDDTIELMVNRVAALTSQISWTVQTINQNLRLQYRRLGMEWSNDRQMTFSPYATNHNFLNLTSETTYELRLITLIMGSCEQRTSRTVNFTTIKLQVVVNAPNNGTTFTAGERIVLTCDLDTGGAPSTDVMWTYNDGSIPSTATADGNTLTLSSPSVDDSGNYTCSFRNSSYKFALMINPAPTTSVATPDNSAVITIVAAVIGIILLLIIMGGVIVIAVYMIYLHAKKGANKGTTQSTIPFVHNAAYGQITGAEIMDVGALGNVAYGLTSQQAATHVYDAMTFEPEYI
uniref:Ig-like domain-containing protein n=1 Tax=Amphimedon queenslandica TaxID=400682 RepID=A0A1X7UYY1_AMPQE